ncbi:hypothetical protein [Streptomyces sp. 769]|uniref:hypothetical protein n=1 Tax=Streptomyces sp. 769 TaxID=1262452 RepID=UPI00057E22A3|nr:hypothetical protein [Streptomyces sp. 769]AJC61622.1 hypothetical protein GZL_09099 [Streptomyces sp. 769]
MSVLTTLAIRCPEHRAAHTTAFAVLARASRRIADGALDNTVLQALSAEGTAPSTGTGARRRHHLRAHWHTVTGPDGRRHIEAVWRRTS